MVAKEMVSSEDLVVIHPCLSTILPQTPKDDLKILVRMTDDKSQWEDFVIGGSRVWFVSVQSRC